VGLIPHLTVEENILLVPRLLGWPEDRKKKRAKELLDLIGLDAGKYANKYPSELSGGEAQRVGVARALGADPPVLLFDEPFGAVDPLKREELQDEFIRIQRRLRKTVLFITHDLSEAIRLADYMVIMKDGVVVQADAPERLLKEPGSDFVEQFLGTDRTLQRLTLLTADRIAKPLRAEKEEFVGLSGVSWKPLEEGEILAKFKKDSGEFAYRTVRVSIHAARPYASLKECVSRLLALGLSAIPVVDDSGKVVAEVLFDDIQRITKEG
jgi:osmoprotectant transport system ATP-binding protein